jgi:hypothetical protein
MQIRFAPQQICMNRRPSTGRAVRMALDDIDSDLVPMVR